MSDRCPSCGAGNPVEARFCSFCGTPLVRECPGCGAAIDPDAAFCSSCGIPLDQGRKRPAQGSEREERRVVTVLFADLAGSTMLGEQLDPEDLRRLQGELFDLVGAEME